MIPEIELALSGQYEILQTIGTGGFAKVKLGVHILTGEKVAIKIMDKEKLGNDLPRAYLETEALKVLVHQHICRLYQVIQTERKIILILEYCPGGELFDYIVARDRLPENEACIFFRQIISAVGYIHSQGFAHRDIKPENLLLDDDQRLKLIDFGLCAQPEGGMQMTLDTCCGSPAYAAPELVQGKAYLGAEVDVWSMGVLLYALVCGFLPFEDENLNQLYQKIQAGQFDIPHWLSPDCVDIIGRMLKTKPLERATLRELSIHPWLKRSGVIGEPSFESEYQAKLTELDNAAVSLMSVHHQLPLAVLRKEVMKWQYDHLTATYFLTLKRMQREEKRDARFGTPTFKASFRTPDLGIPDPTQRISSSSTSTTSTLRRSASSELELSENSRRKKGGAGSSRNSDNTENEFLIPSTPVVPQKKNSGGSEQRIPLVAKQSSGGEGTMSPAKSLDTGMAEVGLSTGSPIKMEIKYGSSKKNLFGSFEKGIDKMKLLLTPKKSRRGSNSSTLAEGPSMVKGLQNVSTTCYTDPELIIKRLHEALQAKGIFVKRKKGYTLRGKSLVSGNVSFELEVCQIPGMNYLGVRRKRLKGDAWAYKKICEQVLALASS
ncbi:unnamed protein product [Cyprideis torosa]|uniref:non-specific serine/threonine protein kinase n=1 Tax=Cyprideis torosa TaxID=163714 RepID=A0A7R8WF11_9CRUS|nr:unnamed protein product [Cyprideis torosa]CAG0896287.1 unnamed protein product [Cyprideis torosa]